MAKIPRIDLGNRESSVGASLSPLDTSSSAMIGTVAGISEAAMGVATAAELRERKRQADAMDAKQKIVDASDTGRLTTQFEGQLFSIEDKLHAEFADNPTAALDEYVKRAREVSPQIVAQAPKDNDFVKLAVTQGNEANISSGLARMHTWVAQRQTERVKGNLALVEFKTVNAARDYTSIDQLKNAFSRLDANPEFDMVYGGKATEKRNLLKADMAKAQLESQSEHSPISTRKLLDKGSGFYGGYLKPDDFVSLRAKTERDALNLADTRMLDTLTSFGERGNKLLSFANAGMADASVIFTERTDLEARRRAIIDDSELSPDAKSRQFAEIEKQKKFIDAAELWQARNTRAEYIGDDDVPAEVWVQRDKVFANDNPPLASILEYRQMILDAANNKRVSPAKATMLMQEVGLATPAAIVGAKDNEGWFFWKNDVQAGTRAAKREIDKNANENPLSAKAEGRVYSKYVELYTAAQKRTGQMPNREGMIKLARQAFYLATDTEMPKGLR